MGLGILNLTNLGIVEVNLLIRQRYRNYISNYSQESPLSNDTKISKIGTQEKRQRFPKKFVRELFLQPSNCLFGINFV